ncbi:hypothetical protein [Ramlibacter alkalitolerans]|uniref:hypothetical protein n=1 Tax=Ramlibacter alkalitolerans TaxID=2039631 RepID=UPI001918A172|nr:hypothetical protein [Ramlibacter alkalitolerans]
MLAASLAAALTSATGNAEGSIPELTRAVAVVSSLPGPLVSGYRPEQGADNAFMHLTLRDDQVASRCSVTYDPRGEFLQRGAFAASGLSLAEGALFVMLHEKGHCANWSQPRPATGVGVADKKQAQLVEDLQDEAFADVYAVLWMSKLAPEKADHYLQSVLSLRYDEWYLLAGEAHTHYTVPTLEQLELQDVALFGPDEWRGLEPSRILTLASTLSVYSARSYRTALSAPPGMD